MQGIMFQDRQICAILMSRS